jgi:myosin-7
VDDLENVLLAFSYPEITMVSSNKTAKVSKQSFCFTTIKGDIYTFTSRKGEDIRDLVLGFLEGLRRRSTFVVAMMDYQSPEADSRLLSFKKGDLIELEADNGFVVKHSGWCFGKCDRSGGEGDFPAKCVYVLPSIVRPPEEFLALFQRTGGSGNEAVFLQVEAGRDVGGSHGNVEKYTIDEFAVEHFRLILGRQSKGKTKNPWAHDQSAITSALLKKVAGNKTLNAKAVEMYHSIMRYMGDSVRTTARFSSDFSDAIIEHALQHDALRDEVYCQLMKQLTDTESRQAEERGWELFWLCAGCFTCSSTLLPEIKKFMAYYGQTSCLAGTCLTRLAKIQLQGQRKYPPHLVEIEAIQNKKISMLHKVYLPDDSNQVCGAISNSGILDAVSQVCIRLLCVVLSVESF